MGASVNRGGSVCFPGECAHWGTPCCAGGVDFPDDIAWIDTNKPPLSIRWSVHEPYDSLSFTHHQCKSDNELSAKGVSTDPTSCPAQQGRQQHRVQSE